MDSFGRLSECMVDADAESLKRERRFRRWGLFASVIFQTGLLAALILIPLATPAVLPHFVSLVPVLSLRPVRPEPPVRVETATHPTRPIYTVNGNAQPSSHPHAIRAPISADAAPDLFPPGGGPALSGDFLPGTSSLPPSPPHPRDTMLGPVHKSSTVMEAMLTNRIEPTYPRPARLMHISGPVVISAIIAADGSIESVRVISGNPMLVSAALAAVREWHYKPTLLNGVPVEVETVITVNFVLDQE